MADTVSTHNQLTVNLANVLDDPLAGADNGIKAAAGGLSFSAAILNQSLAEAYRWLATQLVTKYGVEKATKLCEGIIDTQPLTFATGGTTLNKNYLAPFRMVNSSLPVFVLMSRSDLALDLDPVVSKGYALDNNRLYGYVRTTGTLSIQSSGAGTFYYIKADRVVTAVTATATAAVSAILGSITTVTVTNSGSDYQSVPVVTVTGGSPNDAVLTAVLTNGRVTSITITNGGTGYITVPTISIAAPGGTAGALVGTNTIPDTTIDPQWLDACMYYAAARCCEYKGAPEWIEKGKLFSQKAYSFFGT